MLRRFCEVDGLGARRGLASAGNRIKRGEAPKIETFASEVTRKENGTGGVGGGREAA